MPSQLQMLVRGLIGVSPVSTSPPPVAPRHAAEFRRGRHLQHASGREACRGCRTAAAGDAAAKPGRQRPQARHSPAHVVQRPDIRPPAHRIRPPSTRYCQRCQEQVRCHGQRRRRIDLRWRSAPLAAQASGAGRASPDRADTGVGPQPRATGNLRQPHPVDGRRAPHRDCRPGRAASCNPRIARRDEGARSRRCRPRCFRMPTTSSHRRSSHEPRS